MANIILTSGENAGQEIALAKGVNTIGRRGDCSIILTDPSVSGFHCVITVLEDGVTIEDKGSTNGTRVNKKKISSVCGLYRDDKIRFGSLCAQIQGDDVPLKEAGVSLVERPKISLHTRKAGDAPAGRPKDFGRRADAKAWKIVLLLGIIAVVAALGFWIYTMATSK